jgi:hypothetical protein
VIQIRRFAICFFLLCAFVFTVGLPMVAGQTTGEGKQDPQIQKDVVPEPASKAADVAGNWQVAWTSRGGTQQCLLHLQQDGTKLTGTFQDVHGLSRLSGAVHAKELSFDVEFGGRYPFTIRFAGAADGGKIEGTSQAVGAPEFLGHGGEIVHPEHPWTAKRVAIPPTQSAQGTTSPNPPARN